MLTIAVMPCLNEEGYVQHAIASLLQPAGDQEPEPLIIAVNNGSTDGTANILTELARKHPACLNVVEEPVRGYVPARRRGVAAAMEIAAGLGMPEHNVLILQVDADTIYLPGYVAAMRRAAGGGEGFMLEGSIGRSPDFRAEHPRYVDAERLVDAAIESLEAVDEDDVVVDDKVCAYRLSDYSRWGGLFEEWSADGDAVHAETTRLFIRAKLLTGARKLRVNSAGAFPSRRRVLENARYHFATLGFPRERTWAERQLSATVPLDADTFAGRVLGGQEPEAVRLRAAHLLALFRFLPAVVLQAAGADSDLLRHCDVATVLGLLPKRSRAEFAERPASAFLDVLGLVDLHPEVFERP